MPKMTIEQFLNDPAYSGDREFFEKAFDHCMNKRLKAAKEKAEKERKDAKPVNMFDAFFGGEDDSEGDQE